MRVQLAPKLVELYNNQTEVADNRQHLPSMCTPSGLPGITAYCLFITPRPQVPFRLTRMMIKAMEVSGIEGNFRSTAEAVLRVLRMHKDSVMAMLEAFVHDPLINWRLLNTTEAATEAALGREANAAGAGGVAAGGGGTGGGAPGQPGAAAGAGGAAAGAGGGGGGGHLAGPGPGGQPLEERVRRPGGRVLGDGGTATAQTLLLSWRPAPPSFQEHAVVGVFSESHTCTWRHQQATSMPGSLQWEPCLLHITGRNACCVHMCPLQSLTCCVLLCLLSSPGSTTAGGGPSRSHAVTAAAWGAGERAAGGTRPAR